MTLDGKILRGLFEHKRLKLANVRTSQGNVQNLAQLKQVINTELKIWLLWSYERKLYLYYIVYKSFNLLINMYIFIYMECHLCVNRFKVANIFYYTH